MFIFILYWSHLKDKRVVPRNFSESDTPWPRNQKCLQPLASCLSFALLLCILHVRLSVSEFSWLQPPGGVAVPLAAHPNNSVLSALLTSNPLFSDGRRRLRRPSSSTPSSILRSRDQETSASVNRFKVRNRLTAVVPGTKGAVVSTNEKEGYKVRPGTGSWGSSLLLSLTFACRLLLNELPAAVFTYQYQWAKRWNN